MPLSAMLFRDWNDRGWIFSKSLGILCGGYVMWVLSTAHLLKFTAGACAGSLVVPAVAAAAGGVLARRREGGANSASVKDAAKALPVRRILAEEALFFALLALAVYVIGFRPEAYGTEKFMDYGFVTSMLRSEYMPFADMWFAGESVNYYYGGQFFTAYLIRLSRVGAGEGYTFMRALITALSFMLPFSLASQMMRDRGSADGGRCFGTKAGWASDGGADHAGAERKTSARAAFAERLSGLLAGLAVAFCGNGHYIVYGVILSIWNGIRGVEYHYWFPDSTRFIGYHPDVADKTIHEFPAYSSILGDLHAHYINILFVVLVTAIAYAWARRVLAEKKEVGRAVEKAVLAPEVLLIGAMTGMFRWTNFWDFPIYYVVCGAVLFFVNLKLYEGDVKSFFEVMPGQAAVMFIAGKAAALPFTSSFDQISSSIGRTHAHSALWQLLILWGMPVVISVWFIAARAVEAHRGRQAAESAAAVGADAVPGAAEGDATAAAVGSDAEAATFKNAAQGLVGRILVFFRGMELPDLCAAVFAMCAMGLVWLPEVIYVKDIYGEAHHRANTMFKLTYQAYILFGIVMAYVLVRAIVAKKSRISFVGACAGIYVLAVMSGYTVHGSGAWFGNVFRFEDRVGADAAVFVEEKLRSDAGAIEWLCANVEGQPVVLEANGDSYSDYGRVSVATGLPTVLGWYVHEWLWRSDTYFLKERAHDVELVYTGTDAEEVLEMIRKYEIRYVYVGKLEREKFPALNDGLLREVGTVVYEDGETYIVEMP